MWYKHQAKQHSKLVRYVDSIGKTHHGLDMPAVHLTASTNPSRHKIYFQCQIHARESTHHSPCTVATGTPQIPIRPTLSSISYTVSIKFHMYSNTFVLLSTSSWEYVYVFSTGEWISGAVCMYIVNHLLTQYNQTDAVSVCVYVYVLLLL